MKCLVGVFLALLMFYAVLILSRVKPVFFFLSTTLGWNESHVVRFLCFCGYSMHVAQAPVFTYRWMPGEDAGCPVSISSSLYSLEAGSLIEPGARLEASKLYHYSCLQPP